MLGLAAGVVLQMDHGSAARELADVCGRLLAANSHPAGVQLGLEQVGGDGIVQHLQGVLAVDLLKLEIVVVVQEGHAQLLCHLAQHLGVLHHLGKAVGAGAALGGQVGDGHVLTADLGVVGEHALGVGDHIVVGDVGGDGGQADLGAQSLNLGGGLTVKSRELHALVAHGLDGLQGALKIGGGLVTNGVQLDSNRQHRILLARRKRVLQVSVFFLGIFTHFALLYHTLALGSSGFAQIIFLFFVRFCRVRLDKVCKSSSLFRIFPT